MTCMRCTECYGFSHHWFSDLRDQYRDPDFQPGGYGCKHCEQRGNACETCWTDKFVVIGKRRETCPTCGGEGVVPMSDQDYSHANPD